MHYNNHSNLSIAEVRAGAHFRLGEDPRLVEQMRHREVIAHGVGIVTVETESQTPQVEQNELLGEDPASLKQ